MILRQLHVDGFGKLTDVDMQFSDNINLIWGDNEAGKSTLCNFIFHMLYGMERSRGKASRFDAYVRYLPWQSSSYGGNLTFDAEGTTWFLERSFLSEHRYFRLTRLDDGAVFSNAEALLSRLLNNVSEESFRAMYMLSSHSCSDISSLAEILRQYTQNLPGSGSYTYSAPQAIKNLKRQLKDLSSQLSGTSKSDLCRMEEELSTLKSQLYQPSSIDTFIEGANNAGWKAETSDHRPWGKWFSILVSALFMISGILFCIYPPFWDIAIFNALYFLLPAFCFMAGLFLLLKRVRHKSPNPDFDNRTDGAQDPATLPSDHLTEEALTLLNQTETLLRQKLELERHLASDAILRQKIAALQMSIDTISSLSTELHRTFSPELQRTFARHASLLTGRPFSQLLIDESFHFSLMEENHIIPIEALSRGTVTQLFFACRLAAIELIHSPAELPLLLDDVFSLTDDSRLSVLLSRLCMDYSGQKFIFSCQKREAVILSQHSLSYHLIRL